MAKLKKCEFRAYVTPEDYKLLERESISRKLSVSKTARDCLIEYFNLREELATTLQEPGKAGDNHTGKIIHTLLARTEERIAATIEKLEERISQLHDQNLLLTAMVDRMYMGLMQHLPEIPAEIADGVVASAKRRHAVWLKTVEKLIAEQ